MITRRNFLKGAAAGAVGAAALGVLGGCSRKSSDVKFDKKTEVLIVGAGGAGMAAAVQASTDGAKVLVLEKAGLAGGTTNYSGGVMQAAGTSVQKKFTSYKNDTPENHYKLWTASGEGYIDEELVKDLAYGAPDHIEWLTGLGIKWTHVYGHCHVPYIDDSFYADRIHVYEGGGGEGGGTILIQTLLSAAESNGVIMEYDSEATELILNEKDEVVGLIAIQDGKETAIKATKGVILAAGSIDNNMEMAKQLSPQQYWDLSSQICLCAATDTGDGIKMANAAGAAIGGFGGTIDFCGKTGAATDNRFPMFPYFIVNTKGLRFVCEDATYAYHFRAIFQQVTQLQGPTYMIFGASSLKSPYTRWTAETLEKDLADGAVISGNTIEELAGKIGVNPKTLARTLKTWNENSKDGEDPEYGRNTGIEPLSGPFYAYKNVSFNLGAIGGVLINKESQALKPNGEIVPRLYASGLNAGGWIGPYYPGSGTAIMGLMHWGRKAGAHAAALSPL